MWHVCDLGFHGCEMNIKADVEAMHGLEIYTLSLLFRTNWLIIINEKFALLMK